MLIHCLGWDFQNNIQRLIFTSINYDLVRGAKLVATKIQYNKHKELIWELTKREIKDRLVRGFGLRELDA